VGFEVKQDGWDCYGRSRQKDGKGRREGGRKGKGTTTRRKLPDVAIGAYKCNTTHVFNRSFELVIVQLSICL